MAENSPDGTEACESGKPLSVTLLENMDTALQAQEKLHRALRKQNQLAQCQRSLEESNDILESLRQMKGREEGTLCMLERPDLYQNLLQPLKQLVLMHVPQSLTNDDKQQITLLVKQAFRGECREVLFIGLATCPWYQATQPERGQQARHNTLMVVYLDQLEHLFSAANQHVREQREVLDMEWFYAIEAGHFARCLLTGRARCVECLFMTEEAQIFMSEHWQQLQEQVQKKAFLGLPTFLEQTTGQAVGMVAKKAKKAGPMRLKDVATLQQFAQSFRLLDHADQALTQQDLRLGPLNEEELNEKALQAWQKLKAAFSKQEGYVNKQDIFEDLLNWRKDVDSQKKALRSTKSVDDVYEAVGRWLAGVRLQGQEITPNWAPEEKDLLRVQGLLSDVGESISTLSPENIILIARAGSYLYGLSTVDSDVDYIVVFKEPTMHLLSTCKKVVENRESRGPDKMVEYGAYEVRLFSEMLIKGSVVASELLFVDDIAYASPAWKALLEDRQVFVTEHLIQQYFGLVSNNLHMIHNERYKDAPRERKLFYQIFHKLLGIEEMLEGRPPQVLCTGEVKDFIMDIRQQSLEGALSRDSLIERAEDKYEALKEKLIARERRLPEYASYPAVMDWLMKLRGC